MQFLRIWKEGKMKTNVGKKMKARLSTKSRRIKVEVRKTEIF